MLTIQIDKAEEVIQRFDAMPAKLHAALLAKMNEVQDAVVAKVRGNLSGAVLNARSGVLRNSISGQIDDSNNAIVAKVGSYGVPYAAIHEYGGTTRPHVILPSKASVLAFVVDGRQVFTNRVNHPGSKIPERSYLRSALADLRPYVIRSIGEAAVEAAIL